MQQKKLKGLIVLFKAHQNVFKNVRQSLEGSTLSLNEFTTMEALYSKGSLTTHELINLVLIPNSSMTYVLDTLEGKEYIVRSKDPSDKRVQRMTLTPSGRSLFERVYEEHYKCMRSVFDTLSTDEETQLIELLKKLGKAAEERSE